MYYGMFIIYQETNCSLCQLYLQISQAVSLITTCPDRCCALVVCNKITYYGMLNSQQETNCSLKSN